MRDINAGSSKKIGKYELMLTRPVGRWDVLELTVFRYGKVGVVRSRRQAYSTGFLPAEVARNLYRRLKTVKSIEMYLKRRGK